MKIDYYSRYLKYKQKYINLIGGLPANAAPKYYLYLTLADGATPGIRWGGTHITIIGGGNDITRLRTISANFNNSSGSPRWTLNDGSNLREPQLGQFPALYFDSDTLDRFSQQLIRSGFQNVKGPSGNAHHSNPWHISVPAHSLAQQMTYFTSAHRYWHLTICTEIGGQFTWERVPVRRIGFDFDGVIHTNVDGKTWSRNPIDHNRRDNPCFTRICNKIRERALLGYEIFIITARSDDSRDIIRANLTHCGITTVMIPDLNIRTIGDKSKADLAIQLGLEEFHDDSQKQISDFMQKQQALPTPFKLYKTLPEQNRFDLYFEK